MVDAGVKSGETVTNFCPGRTVPSLQVGVSGRMVHAVKVATVAGEDGGHSDGVVGQQSQSISSSICSNVRPLFAAYIVYTLDGVVVGVPPLSFQRSIQQLSAAAIVSLVAIPFLRYRWRKTDIARKSQVLALCPFLPQASQITRGRLGRIRRVGSGFRE